MFIHHIQPFQLNPRSIYRPVPQQQQPPVQQQQQTENTECPQQPQTPKPRLFLQLFSDYITTPVYVMKSGPFQV